MVKAMCCNCEYFSFRDQTFLGMPLLEINNDFQQHSGFYWHFLSDSPVTVTLSPHSMTHSAAEWLLSCRELRVVWCVVLASLPSPSMLGNAGLRSVVIHAVTSSSVPVSSFLSVKSCTSPGLLRLKPTALVSLVMAEPVQQWNWPQVFFFCYCLCLEISAPVLRWHCTEMMNWIVTLLTLLLTIKKTGGNRNQCQSISEHIKMRWNRSESAI